MTHHRVRQGECMASIAAGTGFLPDVLWNHPENRELKDRRRNPSILFPGDVVFIPEKETRTDSGGTEERHRFQRRGRTVALRLTLADEQGDAWADTRYRLRIESRDYEGATDGTGALEHEIPAAADSGELTVWLPPRPADPEEAIICMDGEDGADPATARETDASTEEDVIPFTWSLAIGHLDPVEEVSGIQARLRNLGYGPGAVDGNEGPATRAAIERFQEARGLTVSGRADEATRAALQERHGC